MEFTNIILNLSVIIIGLITALLLYFGKIIADTKVEKYERIDLKISGLFFTLLFILFPLALNIFFYEKNWIINVNVYIVVLAHLTIIGTYSRYHIFKNIKKLELEKEYDKQFDKKIDKLKRSKSILSKFINQEHNLSKQSLNLFDIIFRFFENNNVLLILSTAIFYSIMITIKYNFNVLSITSISILSFVNISMIAVAYGTSTAYYPPSKIILNDGKTVKGKILKFGEFIYLIKNDKKYFINKNQIKIIEQNIMKAKK